MVVAGVDGHATYSVIAIVSNSGEPVYKPARISHANSNRLVSLLENHRPVEVLVETCPGWSRLFDLVGRPGIHLVLAHAKRLRAIAASSDGPEARGHLARVRLRGLRHRCLCRVRRRRSQYGNHPTAGAIEEPPRSRSPPSSESSG